MISNLNPIGSRARVLLIAIAVFFPLALPAADIVFAGGNLADDLEVDVSNEIGSVAEGTFNVHPGFRVGIGYEFIPTHFLSVELEAGFIYNSIDNEGIEGFEAWYGQVPALVNVVFRHDFKSGLTPFIGIGGGVSVGFFNLSYLVPEGEKEDSSADLVPAWQAFAGLRYRFHENWALALTYKYLETGSPEITIGDERFEFEAVSNHFLGLQLNFNY